MYSGFFLYLFYVRSKYILTIYLKIIIKKLVKIPLLFRRLYIIYHIFHPHQLFGNQMTMIKKKSRDLQELY